MGECLDAVAHVENRTVAAQEILKRSERNAGIVADPCGLDYELAEEWVEEGPDRSRSRMWFS